MKNFNLEAFCNDISNKLEYLPYHSDSDPNLDITYLLNLISETVNVHALLRIMSRKQMKLKANSWITKGLLKSITTKNRLFHQYYKQQKTHLILKYKSYRNTLTKLKDIAKKAYYQNELYSHKTNMSKQWEIINEIVCCERPPTELYIFNY